MPSITFSQKNITEWFGFLRKQLILKVFLEKFPVPSQNKTFPVLATTFKPWRSGLKVTAQGHSKSCGSRSRHKVPAQDVTQLQTASESQTSFQTGYEKWMTSCQKGDHISTHRFLTNLCPTRARQAALPGSRWPALPCSHSSRPPYPEKRAVLLSVKWATGKAMEARCQFSKICEFVNSGPEFTNSQIWENWQSAPMTFPVALLATDWSENRSGLATYF